MARIICIDYGQKRSGVAVTDELQIIASPLTFLETPQLLSFISSYVQQEKVEELLIGYPIHHDGKKTYLCSEIDAFLEAFTKQFNSIRISKIDESYSSVEAKSLLAEAHTKKKKRHTKGELDKMSAVVLLRRHMNY